MKNLILNLYIKKEFSIIILTIFLSINSYASSIRIMPLGDSITHGYPSGYRNYLWYKLQNAQYNVDFIGSQNNGYLVTPYFDSDHEGYGGWKTYEIAEIVYRLLEDNQPDVILLHIGSNDASPSQMVDSSSVVGLEQILNQIDAYEYDYAHPIKIILAAIINRKFYHKTVTDYNRNLRAMANERILSGDDITLVDMENDAALKASDFKDLTHPNDSGYLKMSNVWFNALDDILPELIPSNPLIKLFVERFYTNILLREGEESGISYWTEELETYRLTAADLARGFIFSNEFENQNTDDITFLKILYRTFLDRVADDKGLDYWTEELNQGKSRFSVLNGFLYSQEFNDLAQSYNILTVDPSEFFVARFYTIALNRDPEKDGFIYWVSQLRAQIITAKDIAKSFFFSEEFISKNVDDETYLTLLYLTILNRDPDVEGLDFWLMRLEEGDSRYEILDSFIYSPEFKSLAESYGVEL